MNTKKFIFLLCTILFISLAFIPAKADSGFDTSYDSSSSSSSSSSSHSSSSYGSSSSTNGGGAGAGFLMTFLLELSLGIVFCCLLGALIVFNKRVKSGLYSPPYDEVYFDISPEIAASYGIENLTILKLELFQKFVDIQNAWMNFDYPTLQRLCTDELYNMYKEQLKVLKLKHNQNIMSDFKAENVVITNIKEENNTIIVETYMRVAFFDYIIDTNTNEVIKGDNSFKIRNEYIMEFVKSSLYQGEIVHCPNCNNEVHVNASGKCEYCGSTIVKDSKEFVLSKKQIDGGNNDD